MSQRAEHPLVRPVRIPVEAYVSESYLRAENERLWGKVWQIACRVEEIPEVGDYVTYDILDESIIVVRYRARPDLRVLQRVSAPRPPPDRGLRARQALLLPFPRLALVAGRRDRPTSWTGRTGARS